MSTKKYLFSIYWSDGYCGKPDRAEIHAAEIVKETAKQIKIDTGNDDPGRSLAFGCRRTVDVHQYARTADDACGRFIGDCEQEQQRLREMIAKLDHKIAVVKDVQAKLKQ